MKPLIILDKSFPLLRCGEAELIQGDIFQTKPEKGALEIHVFTWIRDTVMPHNHLVDPNENSLLLVDNYGSRFSVEGADFSVSNNIEILTYSGHLTHILPGPDVVLNKPINTISGE